MLYIFVYVVLRSAYLCLFQVFFSVHFQWMILPFETLFIWRFGYHSFTLPIFRQTYFAFITRIEVNNDLDGGDDRNENDDLEHPVLYRIASGKFSFAKYVFISEHCFSQLFFLFYLASKFNCILKLSLISLIKFVFVSTNKNSYKLLQLTNT